MATECPTVAAFRRWQRASAAAARFSCTPIPFRDSTAWRFENGALRHRSGGFFSLAGIEASARERVLDGFQQLVILQPSIAINGFLLQRREGRPHLLFHGRVEPGNVGGMQLAPTVQSTPANYRRVHDGRPTPFVEYFLDPARGEPVLDVLQSEEGTRYHGKYNRNVVVRLNDDEEVETPPAFRWFDLASIAAFARADNVLNTDSRSVLSSLSWRLMADGRALFPAAGRDGFSGGLKRSLEAAASEDEQPAAEAFAWLSHLRARLGLRTRILPIEALANWVAVDGVIREREPRLGFVARQFRVVAHGREVDEWDQPLIDTRRCGRLALVCQSRGGVLRFLVRASREVGFLEGVQVGPSLQVPPQGSDGGDPVESALLELAADPARCEVIQRCRESEEGGRFFQDENDYELLRLAPSVTLPSSEDYRWMTLRQIRELIRVSGFFSMELRGVLSLLLAHAA